MTSLRSAVVDDNNQSIIYVVDVLSQPASKMMMETDPLLLHQCSRALPIATESDIVVLHGELDIDYHLWLRELGLSTDFIYDYKDKTATSSLAERVISNPSPILDIINSKKMKEYIYLAFYLSSRDIECAKLISALPFGCDEATTKRYFDKLSFKRECQELGIPIIEGHHHDIDISSPLDQEEMEELIHRLLANYGKVIVRGTEGSAGRSLYTIDQPDINELYEQIIKNRDKTVLIEPFLNVVSSPNDQWVINTKGQIKHLGLSAQLFQGLKHAGNFYGTYYSPRIYDYISETSEKIVKSMATGGYRGILGIDYIVCEEGIFPIENNARMNGSSFALEFFNIAQSRNNQIKCWKFFKASCDKMTFKDFKKRTEKYLYDNHKTNSLFPFVTNLIPLKGQFIALLLAEDNYHLDYLQDSLSYLGIYRA